MMEELKKIREIALEHKSPNIASLLRSFAQHFRIRHESGIHMASKYIWRYYAETYVIYYGDNVNYQLLGNVPEFFLTTKYINQHIQKNIPLFDMVVRIYFKLNIELYASKLYKQYAVR